MLPTTLLLLSALVAGEPAEIEMVEVPGGTVMIGQADMLPEEQPPHEVTVEPLRFGKTEVTNVQYAAFVEATGYVTVAERPLDPANFPGADPAMLVPGSVVFTPPPPGVEAANWQGWWRYVPGASWKHPGGPDTDLQGKDHMPVVQIAYEDAVAFADWAEARLPTEAEWEAAARGGLAGQKYVWGDESRPEGKLLANFWQGEFPTENTEADGYRLVAPVGSFEPNGYGLYDMAGNVWEWTSTPWSPSHAEGAPQFDIARVIKGGSFLCADSYCHRYRPAGRSPGAIDTGLSHLGFRVVKDAAK